MCAPKTKVNLSVKTCIVVHILLFTPKLVFSSYPLFHFSLSRDTTATPPDTSPDESALALHLLPAMTVFYPSLISKLPLGERL